MPDDTLTREDFRESLRDLKEDLNRRFDDHADRLNVGINGINTRLDKLNGQTLKNTTDIAGIQATCASRHIRAFTESTAPAASPSGLVGVIREGGWRTIGPAVLLVAGAFSALVNLVVKLVEAILPKTPTP